MNTVNLRTNIASPAVTLSLLLHCEFTNIASAALATHKVEKVTNLCIKVEELLGATVLEGLFGEYHFSSAALGSHLSVIGQHHPYGADVKMSFVQIIQRKANGRGEIIIGNALPP